MLYQLKGFTLISALIATFLTVLLTAALIVTYISMQRRYLVISNLSQMHQNAIYLLTIFSRKLSCDASKVKWLSQKQVLSQYHLNLHALSKILVDIDKCYFYYLAKTSWQDQGSHVTALFQKPLQGARQELISNVIDFKLEKGTIGFVLRSHDQLLKKPIHYKFFNQDQLNADRYIYQVWYGKSKAC